MLWGGVGCPVLNLQEQLRALEIHLGNGTLADEDSPSFALLSSKHTPYLAAGALSLRVLQAQLSQVHTKQEHLLQQVDNFTRNPGLAFSFPDWDSWEEDKEVEAVCSWQEGLWA